MLVLCRNRAGYALLQCDLPLYSIIVFIATSPSPLSGTSVKFILQSPGSPAQPLVSPSATFATLQSLGAGLLLMSRNLCMLVAHPLIPAVLQYLHVPSRPVGKRFPNDRFASAFFPLTFPALIEPPWDRWKLHVFLSYGES